MEHQVQQSPALLIAEHRGKKGVVYAAAKESRAYGCSECEAAGNSARAVYQTQNYMTADNGVQSLFGTDNGF